MSYRDGRRSNALAFFAPIRVGEIVAYQAGLNYVGRTSMEIGVRVLAENPLTAYAAIRDRLLTMVHVDAHGRPQPVHHTIPRRKQNDAAGKPRGVGGSSGSSGTRACAGR